MSPGTLLNCVLFYQRVHVTPGNRLLRDAASLSVVVVSDTSKMNEMVVEKNLSSICKSSYCFVHQQPFLLGGFLV